MNNSRQATPTPSMEPRRSRRINYSRASADSAVTPFSSSVSGISDSSFLGDSANRARPLRLPDVSILSLEDNLPPSAAPSGTSEPDFEVLHWKDVPTYQEAPGFLNERPLPVAIFEDDHQAFDNRTRVSTIDYVRAVSRWGARPFDSLSLICPDEAQCLPFAFQPSKQSTAYHSFNCYLIFIV